MKPIAFLDTECYPNYWLLKFKIKNSYYSIEITKDITVTENERKFIITLSNNYTWISFNGLSYDIPMLACALSGYTTDKLKTINDNIIVDKIKHWQLDISKWQPKDHIDIMEVAPGKSGLKNYAGRIHSKMIQDLPYDPDRILTVSEMKEVNEYCGNDLDVLEHLYNILQPQIEQRIYLSKRYEIDLRSKSDSQLAETVLKKRSEVTLSRKLYKPDINWNMEIKYNPPSFISFYTEQLNNIFRIIKNSTFKLSNSGSIELPKELEDVEIHIANSVYKIGIGGLHSQEKNISHISNDDCLLIDNDVASYYPTLILNSGKYPPALGNTFLKEYGEIKAERLMWKQKQKTLPKGTKEYKEAECGNEGGKIFLNGTFGKTGSYYSILFAPEMLLQTTLTGQLSLLMLIEMHEICGISVISANTDGFIIKCYKDMYENSRQLIKTWENVTQLDMEETRYKAIYSRDVNNYFAIKEDSSVKRKGEYALSGLIAKKNPDVEICSDAVAEFLAKGVSIEQSIRTCMDIRKFIVVKKVAGGGVKMHGNAPSKNILIKEIEPLLLKNGWEKNGRKWEKMGILHDARSAYETLFQPQKPEYLGKVVRYYYSNNCPGSIHYATNGNTVGLSEGAKPCMILPEKLPEDIDYDWYIKNSLDILKDIGYNDNVH